MDLIAPSSFADAVFDRLPDNWRLTCLDLRVRRPEGFETDYALPARLRGTLGHALLARADVPEYEAARRILFETLPWRPRADLPKPFTIAVDEEGMDLRVRLTLFGGADRWRHPIFDGLIEGLARGVAAHGREGAPHRTLPIVSVDLSRAESIPVPAGGRTVRLLFRTPLRLGGGRALGMRWGDVVVSLAERAAGLALWQGLRVDPALGAWRAMASRLAFSDSQLHLATWSRRSGAQGGRIIPMTGFLGPLDIVSPPEALMPLLALGETMFAGGGASLGLGRYDLL